MCCVFFREEIKKKSKKKRKRKIKKYTAIGAASVGGGVLLGTLYEYCSAHRQLLILMMGGEVRMPLEAKVGTGFFIIFDLM